LAVAVSGVLSLVPVTAEQKTAFETPAFGGCDLAALTASRGALARLEAGADTEGGGAADLRLASADYLIRAEACHQARFGQAPPEIDPGGMVLHEWGPIYEPISTMGRKWGAGTPFSVPHQLPGGSVTYSYMASGVRLQGDALASNLAVVDLPGFQPCFVDEINRAFRAWSAAADIQFIEVPDSGAPFNEAGANGDIRIGAHPIDGPTGILAHAYYPPPNSETAAGDLHFDVGEPWSCVPGSDALDIGIVAAHEIGHSIGLDHRDQEGRPSVMSALYAPPRATPFWSDVRRAAGVYGTPPQTSRGHDLAINFGPFAMWRFSFGYPWQSLRGRYPRAIDRLSPLALQSGDLDGDGARDLITDFGPDHGHFAWLPPGELGSGQFWHPLLIPAGAQILTGNLRNSRHDDLVANVPEQGIWRSTYVPPWSFQWSQIATENARRMARGNLDGVNGDDLIVDLEGQGLWVFADDSTWSQLHPYSSQLLVAGNVNGDHRDELVASFAGFGLWMYGGGAWAQLHGLEVERAAIGDLDGDGAGEIVVDFGPVDGVWIRRGATWSWLHNLSVEDLAIADLDGNGQDDVVLDFGSTWGLWAFMNDTTWIQIHGTSPQGLTVGTLY
jgi:hypothetical protein